jgi:hypothetical protein
MNIACSPGRLTVTAATQGTCPVTNASPDTGDAGTSIVVGTAVHCSFRNTVPAVSSEMPAVRGRATDASSGPTPSCGTQ